MTSTDRGDLPESLLLAGCGKMGGALLEGWLNTGLDPRNVTVLDPHAPESVLGPLRSRGVAVNPALTAGSAPQILVLAIKPQMLAEAAPGLSARTGPNTLVLSIVAGKTLADLSRAFPGARAFVRAMPNTPAAVRRGMTGVAAGPDVSEAQKSQVDLLLQAVGQVEWLADESLIDAVTAVSGSGPAYVFYLTECLAKAGEAAGFAPDAAMRLARATVEGAGALMAADRTTPPDVLRRNVTSPGGTTAAALAVLAAEDRLLATMVDAVAAAKARAGELSG